MDELLDEDDFHISEKRQRLAEVSYAQCTLDRCIKGTLHSVEKTLIQKAYCVYYYILKERRFFMSINSVVDFSLNFK